MFAPLVTQDEQRALSGRRFERKRMSATVMAIPLDQAEFRLVFETKTVSSANAAEIDEAKALREHWLASAWPQRLQQ
jgi:hypothetical protein